MKRLVFAASAAVVAAALGTVMLTDDDGPGKGNSNSNPNSLSPLQSRPDRSPERELIEAVRPEAIASAADSSGIEPPQFALMPADAAEAVEDFFGYALLRDRNCDAAIVTVADRDGNSRQALKCTPPNRRQRDYEHVDDASLMAMAYSDAGAAHELAVRKAKDPELMHRYLIRAVALDERFAIRMPWVTSHLYPRNAGVAAAGGRYLYAYLRTLVDPAADASVDRDHFIEQGGTEPAASNIRVVAETIFDQMAQLRAEVTADASWLGENR